MCFLWCLIYFSKTLQIEKSNGKTTVQVENARKTANKQIELLYCNYNSLLYTIVIEDVCVKRHLHNQLSESVIKPSVQIYIWVHSELIWLQFNIRRAIFFSYFFRAAVKCKTKLSKQN